MSRYYYSPYLEVHNQSRALMNWIQGKFEGKFWKSSRNRRSVEIMYQWRVQGREAQELLQKIKPFLVIKQAHADLAQYITMGTNGNKNYSSEEEKIRESVYQSVKMLNHVKRYE